MSVPEMSSSTPADKPTQDQARYYAFDHVKTNMMIGVVIAHSGLTYMSIDPGKLWPAKDPHSTSVYLDVLVGYLACITMPVFFVISGYLTSLLIEKQGLKQMLSNRLKRILYPLLIAMLTVVPLTSIGFSYFNFTLSNTHQALLTALKHFYNSGLDVLNFKFLHLWFLYCLVLFCLGGSLIAWSVKKNMPSIGHATLRLFSAVYNTKAAPLIFALPTFLLLSMRSRSIIETPVTFMTNFTVLASHAVFFFFGWILFYEKNIARFKKGDRFFFFTGLIFFIAKIAVYVAWGEAGIFGYILSAINAIFVWFLVFGHLGIFLRYFDQYSRLGRYLSDASYWIYLVHLPVVLAAQALLIPYELGAFVKFLLVAMITFVITIASYNYFVRNTFIGSFLNGRRYRRGLPDRR